MSSRGFLFTSWHGSSDQHSIPGGQPASLPACTPSYQLLDSLPSPPVEESRGRMMSKLCGGMLRSTVCVHLNSILVSAEPITTPAPPHRHPRFGRKHRHTERRRRYAKSCIEMNSSSFILLVGLDLVGTCCTSCKASSSMLRPRSLHVWSAIAARTSVCDGEKRTTFLATSHANCYYIALPVFAHCQIPA